jgi:polyketide cyclase/dehydrase/lipid transport protein
MPTHWEFMKQTRAPMSKVVDYFMHPENLSKLHSDLVKQVTVKGQEGDTITFEQQMEMMRRRIVSQNKLTLQRAENKIVVDTFDGDGKGSRVTMAMRELPVGGTEIKYVADMELGPLGFFAKGPAKSAMEKVVDEDAKNLDAL